MEASIGNVLFFAAVITFVVAVVFVLRAVTSHLSANKVAVLFFLTSLAALFFTWKYMILMMLEYHEEAAAERPAYGRFADWIAAIPDHDESIFLRAWRSVTDTKGGWLFSGQLIMFVGTLVIFLQVEGKRAGLTVYAWAFLCIGFFVAISFTFPLFLFVWWPLRSRAVQAATVPASTVVLVALAGVATLAIPFSFPLGTWAYNDALIALHVFLIVPLFLPSSMRWQMSAPAAYGLVAGLSLACHAVAAMDYAGAVLREGGSLGVQPLVDVFFQHHAQSSISSDTVFVTIQCVLVFFLDEDCPVTVAALLAAATVPASVAATFPLYLCWREGRGCGGDSKEAPRQMSSKRKKN